MTYKQTDRDLIIELAYTVAKLERKVERLEKSLEKTDEKAEMLIDDVVMLDERTREIRTNPAREGTAPPRSKDDQFADAVQRAIQRSFE